MKTTTSEKNLCYCCYTNNIVNIVTELATAFKIKVYNELTSMNE
jgi:cytochrome c-type biogenesis protein CcmH/NrfF